MKLTDYEAGYLAGQQMRDIQQRGGRLAFPSNEACLNPAFMQGWDDGRKQTQGRIQVPR